LAVKPCCLLIWAASALGASGGILANQLMAWEVAVVPFLAWPAIIWANMQLWPNLPRRIRGEQPTNWRMYGLNLGIVIFSTLLFVRFLAIDYIPMVNSTIGVGERPAQAQQHNH
jgi:drug/metabolite transporter (DMT)-like permease